MKTGNDMVREEVRALLLASGVALPEYEADPIVQARVGRFLAQLSARVNAQAIAPTFIYRLQHRRAETKVPSR